MFLLTARPQLWLQSRLETRELKDPLAMDRGGHASQCVLRLTDVQMDPSLSVYCWSPSLSQVIQEDVIIANVSVTFLLRGQQADKFPELFIHQKQSISAADAASPLHDNGSFIFPSNYPATCDLGQYVLFFSSNIKSKVIIYLRDTWQDFNVEF